MAKETRPRKKFDLKRLLLLLPLLLFGAAVGYGGSMLLDGMAGGNDLLFFVYLALMALGLALGFAVQVVLHEAGHLLGGLLSGYRFLSFNIFGFVWQKGADGRLHLGRMQIAGAGGQCLMIPPEYRDGEYPFTLYNLGGVLANLLSAMVFGLLAIGIPLPPLQILLAAQAVVGLFLGLTNGVPFSTPALQNDGKNLLCIRRDPHARRAFWAQMSMAAALGQGVRFRSMPEEWFAPFPDAALDNPITCAVAVQNVSRLMDRLDFAAALASARKLLARRQGVLGIYRLSITLDGAVCELIGGTRPSPLAASLNGPELRPLLQAMKEQPAVLRTQYAVALLQRRDVDGAEALLARFEKAAQKHPNPAEIQAEREILLAIQNAAMTGGMNAC